MRWLFFLLLIIFHNIPGQAQSVMDKKKSRGDLFFNKHNFEQALQNYLFVYKKEKYTVCFQSRLGKTPWIKPYTDDIIKALAAKGTKSILAFSPSFIADCLETTIEGGVEYKEMFESNGGEKWQLVESLNESDTWIECLKDMVVNS
jgi:protoheme ferro-lyase